MTGTRTITVALQDGFDDDTVVISTPTGILEQLEHVSTRTQIGLARELQITVPADATTLRIALPAKGIEHDIVLDEQDGAHFGVSIDPVAKRVILRRSAEPFGYV